MFPNKFSKKVFLWVKISFLVIMLFLGITSSVDASGYWNYSFITRSGSTLYQNGQLFRFSGMNIPWLGFDNSTGGTYPSQFRITDALLTAKEMGASVIRSHTLGISVGCSLCVEPTLGQFSDTAFTSMDYAIKVARDNHMRIMVPLIDNFHYYEGGKHTFTDWRGDSNEDDFYTSPQVIADFEQYISHILNHYNPYTNKQYKNDPTIFAWETGNELENASGSWDNSWTEKIAEYIKSIDPNHLVADGHTSNYSAGRNLTQSQLMLPSIDMYSGHFYPLHTSFMQQDASFATQYGKAYVVGEYDWTNQSSNSVNATMIQDVTTSTDGSASAMITVTQSSLNASLIQLLQGGFSLQANQTYTISFSAKSSLQQNISLGIKQNQWPWTTYFNQNVSITPSWQTYSFTYTPSQSVASSLIEFNVAQNVGQVWFDNIQIIPNGGTNVLQNSSFEGISSNVLSPWVLKVQQIGDDLQTFLSAIEVPNSNISGDMFWQLYGHDDIHGLNKGDQYTLCYPGTNNDMASRAQVLRTHMYAMSQASVPFHLVPPAPQLNSITVGNSGTMIDWRGVIGANTYDIQKFMNGTWQTIAKSVNDIMSPFTDTTSNGQVYSYRIQPINPDGVRGGYSDIEVGLNGILQNGGFDHTGVNWSNPWSLGVTGSASATFTQDSTTGQSGSSALINVTTASPNSVWNVQLHQANLQLGSGSSYAISFYAKGSTGISDGTIVVQQGVSPWTVYTQQQFQVTSNWQKYTCGFSAPINDNNALLGFNLGKYTGQIWIDSVSVVATTSAQTGSCN